MWLLSCQQQPRNTSHPNQSCYPSFPVCFLLLTPLTLFGILLLSWGRGIFGDVQNFFKSNNSLESMFYLGSDCFAIIETLWIACPRFCQTRTLLSLLTIWMLPIQKDMTKSSKWSPYEDECCILYFLKIPSLSRVWYTAHSQKLQSQF